MKTKWIGDQRLIVSDDGRMFVDCEQSRNAVMNLEWANKLSGEASVAYANGKTSHEVANELRDEAEDTLLDYWRVPAFTA